MHDVQEKGGDNRQSESVQQSFARLAKKIPERNTTKNSIMVVLDADRRLLCMEVVRPHSVKLAMFRIPTPMFRH